MPFRPQDLAVIDDFAHQLGTVNRPARDGSCSFQFERSGTFTLTPCREEGRIMVSLARTVARVDEGLMEQALLRAGFDPAQGAVLHAGLAGDNELILSLALDPGQISLPMLESSLRYLIDAFDALR